MLSLSLYSNKGKQISDSMIESETIKISEFKNVLSSIMDWEILSSRPTLLSHKLQTKMAHFASLDSAPVYKTIGYQYCTS